MNTSALRQVFDGADGRVLLWLLAITAITRVPTAPLRMTADTVNLAYGLEFFDPRISQPQPPGYPLFILLSDLMDFFTPDPASTFLVLVIVATAVGAWLITLLTSALAGSRAGWAAGLLMVVSPIPWFSASIFPPWAFLMLSSALFGLLCWRGWCGDRDAVVWAAGALGLGSGFVPELAIYGLPLLAACILRGQPGARLTLRSLAALLAGCAPWIYMLVMSSGSISDLTALLAAYPFAAPLPDLGLAFDDWTAWTRSLSRWLVWMGITVIGWIMAPLLLRGIPEHVRKLSGFVAVWSLPAMVLHAVGGLWGPGQMAFYVPPLCAVGGLMLAAVDARQNLRTGLIIAVSLNILFFGAWIGLPLPVEQSGNPLSRIVTVARYAAWELSIERLRWADHVVDRSLDEVRLASNTNRPVVLVSMPLQDLGARVLHPRVAAFYVRDRDVNTLIDDNGVRSFRRRRGREVIGTGGGQQIPIPAGARILWLVDFDTPFYRKIVEALPSRRVVQYVLQSDLDTSTTAFEVGGFRFVTYTHGIQ